MTIVEFFNPHNIKHLKAYEQLKETGFWPKGFLPVGVDYDSHWQVEIVAKMADAWFDAAKANHIFGMPGWEQ